MHCYFCCLPCLCWHSWELHIRDNCQEFYQSWIDFGHERMNRWELGFYARGWVFGWELGLYIYVFIEYSLCVTNTFLNSFPCSWAAMKSFRHRQTRWFALTHIRLKLRPAARLFKFNIQNTFRKKRKKRVLEKKRVFLEKKRVLRK